MTIREVKACNRVNVKRFNILVNCRVQFFCSPQNLKFLNTFFVFLIIPIRFDLPRFGDSYITTKTCKIHFLLVSVTFCGENADLYVRFLCKFNSTCHIIFHPALLYVHYFHCMLINSFTDVVFSFLYFHLSSIYRTSILL